MFTPVSAELDLVSLEARVRTFWKEHDVFHESVRRTRDKPEWVFYEGPPTANGAPGIHHVWARVFKDIFPRFQTMRGKFVHRKAGWDCHGLPVELEVEKELGFTQKSDIEDYGIEKFNARCRESVQRYVGVWNELTERIGFWVDLDNAYWTMDASYIESVWSNLKAMWDQGLLFESHRVVPHCPRDETALSDHEVSQGYATAVDPSVYVRFPAIDRNFDLLVWTTTPWTLVSNTGVVIHPSEEYVEVQTDGRPVVMAKALVAAVLGEDAAATRTFPGAELVGLGYRRPFEALDLQAAPRVVADEFVTTKEGTGLVHMAPAFGEIDMAIGVRERLSFVNPVGPDGKFTDGPWQGTFVKDADAGIIADLAERGLLLEAGEYEHTYPFCWRCDTPLIYWARPSWYVRTSERKANLLAANHSINWYPDHIKHGRMGDWLANNVDWALSRDRYWGTPLPIWRCESGHDTCVGSFAELGELSGRDMTGFDPHRPYVDDVIVTCPDCAAEARRVPPVIDAWYDSGSMPNAQWHYPFENEETYRRRYPADFIAEAIDQTRGWFYSLLAISTLLHDRSSYRHVLSLGHIVDRDGRKMSKSVGNVIDPFEVLDHAGADGLRWYFFASGTPWTNHRVYLEVIDEHIRRTLVTLWNTYSFFVTYAALDGWTPGAGAPPVAERSALDRWILSRLDAAVAGVTAGLEEFDAYAGAGAISDFVEDLSNWYVRRSRPRFWRGVRQGDTGSDPDKAAAHATLHEALLTVAELLAPFTPFLAEELYQNLTGGDYVGDDSVHFEAWPDALGYRDEALEDDMAFVRRLVSLGRTARTAAKIRVRQPLSRVMVASRRDLGPELEAEVLEELNVKEIVTGDVGATRTYTVKPDFAKLGPRFGARVRDVAARLLELDDSAVVAAEESITIELDGDIHEIPVEDLDIRMDSAAGWAVAEDANLAVALDTEITPELEREGWVRELTRSLQDARKDAGLEVQDRIRLRIDAPGDYLPILQSAGEQLKRDLLAVTIDFGEVGDGVALDVLGVAVRASVEKFSGS